jgi:rod shape-determining protein MreD
LNPKIIDEEKFSSYNYLGQDILAPAKSWYVFLSLAIALVLNFLPLQGSTLILRPDFVAITMLFWCINQPQRVGMSLAFCIGLMMDVGNASILGQHALAYCVMVYFALIFRQRLRIFSLLQQAPQIGLILFIMQIQLVLIALLNDANFPGWHFFLSSVTGIFLWVPISFLLCIPLRSKPDPDAL